MRTRRNAFTIPATLILLAACGANQQVLANPAEGFVTRLEQLVFWGGQPSPRCTSYRWLSRQLHQDTPDMERPAHGPTASLPGPAGRSASPAVRIA